MVASVVPDPIGIGLFGLIPVKYHQSTSLCLGLLLPLRADPVLAVIAVTRGLDLHC